MAVSRKKANKWANTKYLTHFIARAFLIAIIVMIGLIGVIVTCYLVDLSVNVKNGNVKNPLFGAYVIVSPSMVPTININDTIVIKREDQDKYNIGDIITFSSSDTNYEGEAVTHRIVDKKTTQPMESTYTTKGDNNPIVDPTSVATEDIYGKVMFKIPKLGYLQRFFAKPINFFLGILIPAMIVLIYDFSRIYSMMNKRKRRA